MLIKDAPTIWNALKGIICVYKPADVSCFRVRQEIIYKICTELNEMECRPTLQHVRIEGNPSKELRVVTKPNLADHPLVTGPRYQQNDVRCAWSSYLGSSTSGVLLLGLGSGTKMALQIRLSRLTRAYRVKGILGAATDTYYKDGKVVEKSTYKFIKPSHMEKLLTYMQAAHQRKMFELCGVDIQSQTAYELASQGPIRPSNAKIPIIYGIKCVEFKSPEFTIEIQCINEYEMYLKTLIQEIGMKLHSTAHCTSIQCIRHSHFTLDHALLKKHWTLQNITTNMQECNEIVKQRNLVHQENVALQSNSY